MKKHSDVEGKLILTDTVFSMSGDIANLPVIVKLAKDYGATVMIDDARSFSRVKSSLYGDDVNDRRRFRKEFARHICGRVLRYHSWRLLCPRL